MRPPANPRYKVVRTDSGVREEGGLWLAHGRLDFEDSGASNVGNHGMLATEGAHLLVVNPKEPTRIVTVWFSRRGAAFNDARFTAEADRFLGSFR